MPLFEVAMLLKPTKKEQEEGQAEKLVFGPKTVIARDKEGAGMVAVLQDGADTLKGLDLARVEVLIRPFA